MLEIFICEDDKIQREKLSLFVEGYIEDKNYDMHVTLATDDPFEILAYAEKHNPTGLYFLDIDLESKMTGMQLAARLREFDRNSTIIFITTHVELMQYTFRHKLEALDFIEKSNFKTMRGQIAENIDYVHAQQRNATQIEDSFKIEHKNKILIEKYSNIMFFESSVKQHRVILHATNRQEEFYGNLNDIEKMSDCFIRSHRSYVVNHTNIEAIDVKKRELLMKNGEICSVSYRQLKKLLH